MHVYQHTHEPELKFSRTTDNTHCVFSQVVGVNCTPTTIATLKISMLIH